VRGRADRIAGMVVKEFRQMFRDPRMARVIFIAPVIQLLIFGYAVSTDIADTPTFLVDHDRSRASRELVDALIVRAVFLKGAGFDALSRQFAALFVIGTSILLFAATRFRKS
jgi:ABC-2 type transport system permease protein